MSFFSISSPNLSFIPPTLSEKMDAEVTNTAFSIGHYRNVRRLGRSMVVFRVFEKLRYSNEKSTIF